MGGSNYSLLNKIGISEDQNTFSNPIDQNRKIHVFADVPCLLKRDDFLDHGFHTVDKEKIIKINPQKYNHDR